ncbi:divergent PAP2 family protein [bacterium]|nr:divergent PAP2 family protein [bacterium]
MTYYFIAPILGWFVSGTIKYIINYFRYEGKAKEHIGTGGFPSTHTTVITTPTVLIGLKEGFTSPIFGLAVAIMIIVIMNATDLRREVGKHAKILNTITNKERTNTKESFTKQREKIGHSWVEIIGGLILGIIIGLVLKNII